MGLKGGEMGGKDEVKEKFSIWHFRGQKVEKHTFLRMGGYASRLPEGCFADSASSAILQSRASRTPWHFVPRDANFALFKLRICTSKNYTSISHRFSSTEINNQTKRHIE